MPEVTDAIEEVVDGEIRIMPPPKLRHALIVRRICKSLDNQLDAREILVLDTFFGLVIRKSPLTSRIPDVAVFELATMVEQDGYIHSAPQLLVEVLSPANNRREFEEKLRDYASIGVPEVWVVSPEGLTVEILYLKDSRLQRSGVLAEGILTPQRFPNVHVDIAAIWPD